VKKSVLSQLVYSNLLWGSGLLLLTAACIVDIVLFQTSGVYPMGSYGIISPDIVGAQKAFKWIQLPVWQSAIGWLIVLGSAIGIQFIASEFRLIRVRSYFPFFLVCLLAAAIVPLLTMGGGWLANLLLVYSFQRLLVSAERSKSGRASFDATLLLGIASLFEFRLAYLLPVYWLIMMVLQSMNMRSFWSSVLGFGVVAWLIAGISFLLEDFRVMTIFWSEIQNVHLVNVLELSHSEMAFIGLMLFLVLVSMTAFWSKQHLEKLKTRNNLNSFFLFWMGLLALWLISSNDSFALLHVTTFSALLIAHFFSLTDSLFARLLFFLLVGVSAGAYILS
jgi:hypothetical protein